jgi:AraC-like DNA-binding protein
VWAPFETLHVFIPLRAFDELADELHAARIETLACPMSSARQDPVMLHLGMSLFPAFASPGQASALFADHVFAAMRLHLASTYGGLRERKRREPGGLAPWQARRAQELMQDQLAGDPTSAELASACGMSVRHFARAFKATMGAPPHRWLLERRVERAKELLAGDNDPISDVALACGFADQSHLTRVFRAATGTSPGAWRRQQRH